MERTIDRSYEQKIDTMKNSLDKASEDVSCIQSLTRYLRDLEAKYELAKESFKEIEKESSEVSESQELDLKLALAQNEVEECNRSLVAKREELASLHKNLTEKMKHLVMDLEQSDPLQPNPQEGSSVNQKDATAYCLVDKNVCRLILEDDMKVPNLTAQEVLTALYYSREPANLVLDVIFGSYKQHVANGGAELDASVVKTITLLLDQLAIRRPLISRSVKHEAKNLAAMWKENVIRETTKGTEVLSFLLFLVVFEVKLYLNTQEILGLLVKVSPMRNAPSICRSLCQSLRFDDKIPKLISTLMNMNKYIEAARFSCAFGLLHLHPLDSILENFLDRLRKSAKDKVMEMELRARKAIRHLVFEYNLESLYDASDMTRQIVELETQRSSSMAASLIPVVSIRNSSSANIAPPVQTRVEKRRYGDDEGCSKRPRR